MMTVTHELSVCFDCHMAYHGMELDPPPQVEPWSDLRGILQRDVYPACYGGDEECTSHGCSAFATHICDGCGSHLAGERHNYIVMVAALKPTLESLSRDVEFDQVFEVHADGSVTIRHDLYAPDLTDGELESRSGWTLVNGYSGQDRYSGPIMHVSEYLGGRMAQDVLDTPGIYAMIPAYYSNEDGDESEPWTIDGWAVAVLG
jgi:hypothetical protein